MATYTPPPYFPQGSLSPPSESRYKKLKLAILGLGLVLLLLLGLVGVGLWYLVKMIF